MTEHHARGAFSPGCGVKLRSGKSSLGRGRVLRGGMEGDRLLQLGVRGRSPEGGRREEKKEVQGGGGGGGGLEK